MRADRSPGLGQKGKLNQSYKNGSSWVCTQTHLSGSCSNHARTEAPWGLAEKVKPCLQHDLIAEEGTSPMHVLRRCAVP